MHKKKGIKIRLKSLKKKSEWRLPTMPLTCALSQGLNHIYKTCVRRGAVSFYSHFADSESSWQTLPAGEEVSPQPWQLEGSNDLGKKWTFFVFLISNRRVSDGEGECEMVQLRAGSRTGLSSRPRRCHQGGPFPSFPPKKNLQIPIPSWIKLPGPPPQGSGLISSQK